MGRGARIKIGMLTAVAAASLMVGCGSGDDSGGSEPLSRQAFLKQGNSICEKGTKEKDKLLEAGFKKISADGKEPAQKDLEALVLDVLPPIKQTAEKLGELSPPAKEADKVNAFLGEYEDAVQEAEDDPGSALENAAFLKAPNEAAQRYGLTACSL